MFLWTEFGDLFFITQYPLSLSLSLSLSHSLSLLPYGPSLQAAHLDSMQRPYRADVYKFLQVGQHWYIHV